MSGGSGSGGVLLACSEGCCYGQFNFFPEEKCPLLLRAQGLLVSELSYCVCVCINAHRYIYIYVSVRTWGLPPGQQCLAARGGLAARPRPEAQAASTPASWKRPWRDTVSCKINACPRRYLRGPGSGKASPSPSWGSDTGAPAGAFTVPPPPPPPFSALCLPDRLSHNSNLGVLTFFIFFLCRWQGNSEEAPCVGPGGPWSGPSVPLLCPPPAPAASRGLSVCLRPLSFVTAPQAPQGGGRKGQEPPRHSGGTFTPCPSLFLGLGASRSPPAAGTNAPRRCVRPCHRSLRCQDKVQRKTSGCVLS